MTPDTARDILALASAPRPPRTPGRHRALLWVSVAALAIVAALVAATLPAHSEGATVAGSASTIDGDTIDVGHVRIRLEGIDAPELDQTCKDAAGADWACGEASTDAMRGMVEGLPVLCREVGKDKYKRILALCWPLDAAGTPAEPSVNERLVLQGLAVSFVRYSHQFDAAEAIARDAKAGIWSGSFEFPWDFRARARALAAAAEGN